MKNEVDLYLWRDRPNFGDQMSADIVAGIFQRPVNIVSAHESKKLLAIGSILDKAKPGDVVWGTGLHPRKYVSISRPPGIKFPFRISSGQQYSDVRFLAVRGPITRQHILDAGGPQVDVMCDPAILAPEIYKINSNNKKRKFLLINHFSVAGEFNDVESISPSSDWRRVVDEIVASEVVISSSLHGLILAEAYGVPAVFLHNSREGLIKYIDYYGATGRFPDVHNSIDSIKSKSRYSPPPSFFELANQLIGASRLF